jgi:cytochrome bd ubiquinol oxidase subunit II
MESYLSVIWAAIIGLAVAMYVILDGFDLGIGICSRPRRPSENATR